jgi:integrase
MGATPSGVQIPPSPPLSIHVIETAELQALQDFGNALLVQKGGTVGLKMASPLRRGKNGIVQFRKAVPKDLRKVLGMIEIKKSLGTTDEALARPEFARLNAEWEQRFQSLRRDYTPLSRKDAAALAGEIYKQIVDGNEDDPDPKGVLRGQAAIDGFLAGDPRVRSIPSGDPAILGRMEQSLRRTRRREVEAFLVAKGLNVRPEDVDLVVQAVNPAVFEAKRRLVDNSQFVYRPDTVRQQFPEWVAPADRIAGPGEPVSKKYSILEIFDQMSRERSHSQGTRDRWRPMIVKVAEEHPDIRTLSPDWCVEYKDRLVASGLASKTIKEGNLAALRNVCNYAVTNKRIAASPMDGVSIKVKPRQQLRQTKGYTDEEAAIVLKATFGSFSRLLPADQHAARRWIPWLCAYTGARVGEVSQLRKPDLHKKDGVWLLWITPEAGSVKSHNARYVAVHPHLIDMGFIEFVQSCPRETLFYDASRKRLENPKNSPPTKAAENIAKWVRSLGVTDPDLQPNHGWRHRFKTTARAVGMDPGTRDYMQGQVGHNEAEQYGDFTPKVLLAEISKLPWLDRKRTGPRRS